MDGTAPSQSSTRLPRVPPIITFLDVPAVGETENDEAESGGGRGRNLATGPARQPERTVNADKIQDLLFNPDADSWRSHSVSKSLPGALLGDTSFTTSLSEQQLQISPRITKKLRSLRQAFAERTEAVRRSTFAEPVTPPDSDNDNSSDDCRSITIMDEASAPRNLSQRESVLRGIAEREATERGWSWRSLLTDTINTHSFGYLAWLFAVVLAYIYNVFGIILRAAFDIYYTEANMGAWLAADYVCDAIYLLDLLLVKPRIQCISNGLTEADLKKTTRNYLSKSEFKLDLLSLLPLDILYVVTGIRGRGQVLLRLPRFLKLSTFWEFFDRMDQAAQNAHIVRVMRSMIYLIYLVHIEACGYYAVSNYEGIGSTSWTYSGKNTAYIQCFYLASKTATGIGNNPKPTNTLEFLFMTTYWLSGVFVFAILVGQVRSALESADSLEVNYQTIKDRTMAHLRSLDVPKQLQDKVRSWFEYNWDQQRALDENQLIEELPKKLKTELLIDVHFETLSKVNLFQDCEKDLLLDLILKLVPTLYLPGDYICKKGEVGTEMYIVSVGTVDVVTDDGAILATLSKGSVFGEISLLALSGQNRRTAHVRSKGFSNLFVLHKKDFEMAMEDYPRAHELLKKRARKTIRKNAKHDAATTASSAMHAEEIIRDSRERTPKLVQTVVEVVSVERRDSPIPTWLNFDRRAGSAATAVDGRANQRGAEALKRSNSAVFTVSGFGEEEATSLQPLIAGSQPAARSKSALAGYAVPVRRLLRSERRQLSPPPQRTELVEAATRLDPTRR